MSTIADKQRLQQYLNAFDFKTLFVEELGWDILKELPLILAIANQTYKLQPLVTKRGVKVYVCTPNTQGEIPDDITLRKIEREVTKYAHEHIIIYIDAKKENQVWQWVKREPGKPLYPRHNRLHKGQTGELLAQKLQAISFEMSEEDLLVIGTVAGRVRQAFDVDRVTTKFYDRFQKEHTIFLTFIEGIASRADREWYASLMLNRLMFVYFIQRKGFLDTKKPDTLDGDPDYLFNHLKIVQKQFGHNEFHSFYGYFLLKLFHEGLSKRTHSLELEKVLGKVPYLNGGIFDVHLLERDNPDIQIPDEAFERIFVFFNDFDWHLDDRPLRSDKEINPDVLGYIFEKYINQKQMGAYYTKEDITNYISKNTIIPYLFDSIEQKCLIAFSADGPVWSLLRDNPDRYIFEAIKKGCDLPLPLEIEVGMHDVSRRGEWNKSASEQYAIPTEIWREVISRRKRYFGMREKLATGEIHSINDFITYNLDICQFAQDVIIYCEGMDLLQAFYSSIEQVTVLDPTCGSGAFLFAALNILKPLYEACLDRMQTMVEERDHLDVTIEPAHRQNRPVINRFREILKQVDQHPNRDYFILKSIIINNLYGVDIMEEASEICKLRLFLKLVSQVEQLNHIEPLPDIDFNIRAGNTLVGFSSLAEAKQVVSKDLRSLLTSEETIQRIEQKARDVERDFNTFRTLQTQLKVDPEDMTAIKKQVQATLQSLEADLDRYLASEYGIDLSNISDPQEYQRQFAHWQHSHQPFHWFAEFYGIINKGGFDVIIGNPPYVEYSKVKQDYTVRGYQTEPCGNLYAYIIERSINLLNNNSFVGLIVPHSLVATYRMKPAQTILMNLMSSNYSYFSRRPGKLFDGADQCLCIFISKCHRTSDKQKLINFSTTYQRWYTEERLNLFEKMNYVPSELSHFWERFGVFPKLGKPIEYSILEKLSKHKFLGDIMFSTGKEFYCHRISRYFIKSTNFIPYFCSERDGVKRSDDFKVYYTSNELHSKLAVAALNSSLFYWFWRIMFDGYHCGKDNIASFPFQPDLVANNQASKLEKLVSELMHDFQQNAMRKSVQYKGSGKVEYDEFNVKYSKPIIDEIDRVLAQHYRFTDEELDFIINYDIKYRMGRNSEEGEN